MVGGNSHRSGQPSELAQNPAWYGWLVGGGKHPPRRPDFKTDADRYGTGLLARPLCACAEAHRLADMSHMSDTTRRP